MPSNATAVAIPAAPIQRLAMLPEEHKLRTVQVRETVPTRWSPPLKFSHRSTSAVMVSTCTAPNAKAFYGLTCISSSWICSEVASGRGGKSRSQRWSVRYGPGESRLSRYAPLRDLARGAGCAAAAVPCPPAAPGCGCALALGEVLAQVYQRAAYARRIDYTLPVPLSPLRPRNAAAGSPRHPCPAPGEGRAPSPPSSQRGHGCSLYRTPSNVIERHHPLSRTFSR